MFQDELSITCRAGQGGDGSVHFAKRKYQPFGGPDGGDGGSGGNVVLIGNRSLESLHHLRERSYQGEVGGKGGGNNISGATGADKLIKVPVGTLAYESRNGIELGAVRQSEAQLVIARGGRGGRGNPRFASGQLRAPKTAEEGRPGEEREVLLRYRIYADNALIELGDNSPGTLLATLLDRPSTEIDYPLYLRQPRYVRFEHEYKRYDLATLFYNPFEMQAPLPFPEQLYWVQSAILNLVPLGDLAEEVWPAIWAQLTDIPLKRLTSLVVAATQPLSVEGVLDTEETDAVITSVVAKTAPEALEHLQGGLTGGIIT